MKVSFQPSIEVLNELGDQLTSYANGYISLDEEVGDNPSVYVQSKSNTVWRVISWGANFRYFCD